MQLRLRGLDKLGPLHPCVVHILITAGADASVEALKLYDMKLLISAVLSRDLALDLY